MHDLVKQIHLFVGISDLINSKNAQILIKIRKLLRLILLKRVPAEVLSDELEVQTSVNNVADPLGFNY
jgi:hypothetical protein